MEVLSKSAVDKVMLLVNKIKFQWQECDMNCAKHQTERSDALAKVSSEVTNTEHG